MLGDPGADSGGERKSKRAEKNGAKKSKELGEEPLGTMSYQASSKPSRPFWLLIGARKLLWIFAQSERSKPWSRFACCYTPSKWGSAARRARHVYLGFSRTILYTRGEKIQRQNKMQGKTFGISTVISPVNTMDLSQVSLKVCENIYLFTNVFWM